MKKVHGIDYAIDALRVLADNPYSLLWEITEDFEVNGHEISVKRSHQFKQVIIDGVYQHIGGTVIVYKGVTYKDPLDYVKMLLSEKKETNEKIDFGSGSRKEIREAISNKAGIVNESNLIKVYNRSDDAYKKLQVAANLLTMFTGKDHFVGETYFDYGQDWKWTTILCKDYQALTPRDHEDIILSNSAQEIGKVVDKIISKNF